MPGVGAGCSRSEQDCEDDELEILKSFIECAEIPSTKGNVAVDDSNIFDPVEHQLLSDHSPLTEVHTNDRSLVKNDSVIHSGDTDSSDDECSDYGRILKKMLVDKQKPFREVEVPTSSASSWKKGRTSTVSSALHTEKLLQSSLDVCSDSMFGIRMINPCVSSSLLKEKMQSREAVPLARLKSHVTRGKMSTDWVVAGVVIQKSCMKTSQKGTQYYIWKLSDLKENLRTFSLFLFRAAAKELWKTNEGTVIAVLNPDILENRPNSGDEAVLSVDNAQRILILGTSKDLGVCKAMKKNGDRCTMFVNKSKCEFCVYHLKLEYHKCSKRTELNSPGRSGLINIRNKVLGKNEVFYAGRSFTAIPAKRNVKQHQKDEQRLKSLSSKRPSVVSAPLTHFGITVLSHGQKPLTHQQSDAERLLKLQKGSEVSCSGQGSSTDDMQHISETKSLPFVMKAAETAEKTKSMFSTAKQSK
ncbi:hypothetical protein B7P43_G05124, partial [Cryptotermes secundus]